MEKKFVRGVLVVLSLFLFGSVVHAASVPTYTTKSIVKVLKNKIKNREESFTFNLSDYNRSDSDIYSYLREKVYAHNGVSTEGQYLEYF